MPASRAFGSGIHAAAAYFFRGLAQDAPPNLDDVQGHFEALWNYAARAGDSRWQAGRGQGIRGCPDI